MERKTLKQKAALALQGFKVITLGALICVAAIVVLSTEQDIIDNAPGVTAVV